jgi:hypothetical protein
MYECKNRGGRKIKERGSANEKARKLGPKKEREELHPRARSAKKRVPPPPPTRNRFSVILPFPLPLTPARLSSGRLMSVISVSQGPQSVPGGCGSQLPSAPPCTTNSAASPHSKPLQLWSLSYQCVFKQSTQLIFRILMYLLVWGNG